MEGSGPDHARTFVAVLQIGGTAYGKGSGHSKKEAEQEAAADAWRKLSGAEAKASAEGSAPAGAESAADDPKAAPSESAAGS